MLLKEFPDLKWLRKQAEDRFAESFLIDIDGDGMPEYIFNTTLIADPVGDHLRFALVSRMNNEVAGENGNADVLSPGEQIGPGLAFDYDTEVLVVKSTTEEDIAWWGKWKGVQSKYIGIRFPLKGMVHYGWIRVSVNESEDLVVIHDMAYSQRDLNAGAISKQ